MKKLHLFMGFYLIMQAMTCGLFTLLFLHRGKKKSAGLFMTGGLLSAISGALVVYKQIQAKLEYDRLSAFIDELLLKYNDEQLPLIPLDETASEGDFHE